MKICLVCASGAPGGLEKHVAELASLLAQDHEVHVIAPEALKELLSGNVIFHSVSFAWPRWLMSWSPPFRHAMNSARWDVVHAHAAKAATAVATLGRSHAAECRVVTLHGRKRDTAFCRDFDHVVVVSASLRDTVPPGCPVTVIPNAVSLQQPSRQHDREWLALQAELDPHLPILLAVGRLVPVKGFDMLIRLAAKGRFQVAIAGEGELRAHLEAVIAELAAPVALLGHRHDVSSLMQAADGLLITSEREGGPYTLPEALLQGCPVLATPVGLVPELLPESLHLTGNVEVMAARINHYIDHPATWREACQPGREIAQARFTPEAMCSALIALYEASPAQA